MRWTLGLALLLFSGCIVHQVPAADDVDDDTPDAGSDAGPEPPEARPDAAPEADPPDAAEDDAPDAAVEDEADAEADADPFAEGPDDSLPVDAGPPPERVTWGDLVPFLSVHCGECHVSGSGWGDIAPFLDGYAVTQQPSRYCWDQIVGECLVGVAELQQVEAPDFDPPLCGISEGGTNHRDGFPCLEPEQVALVRAWYDQGMLER